MLNLKVLSWDSSQNNPQRWRGVGVVSVFVLFGGYATFIGQQILIYFVLSLAVFSVTRVRMISQPRHKILLLAFVGFLAGLTSIFLWITMAIFFVFEFLRRTFQSKTRREKPNSLLVALSLVIGATVALAPWQILRSSVPEFDSQVKSESLVSQGIFGPYKKLIQNGVPIEVGVISSFLSNLDLIPNQGWGLDITYSEAMPGNPNFYFGSAPLFGLTPDCVSIPSGGVDQVSEPTIQKFENCDSPETPATIPTIVKSIWSGFHLLASTSILLAIFFGSRKHATTISVETFTLVIAFLLSYSLMLGGIPRYGMPSQVILILVGLSHLTELMRRVQWPVK